MSASTFHIIAAISDVGNAIGACGQLPWRLPEDTAFFQQITTDVPSLETHINTVTMGQKTYKLLPPKFRLLLRRINAVLTTNPSLDMPENISIAVGLQEAIDAVEEQAKTQHKKTLHKVFIIGREKVYSEALLRLVCRQLYITCVYLPKGHQMDLQVDAFFPVINGSVYKLEEQGKRQKSSKSSPPRIKFVFECYGHRGSGVQ